MLIAQASPSVLAFLGNASSVLHSAHLKDVLTELICAVAVAVQQHEGHI